MSRPRVGRRPLPRKADGSRQSTMWVAVALAAAVFAVIAAVIATNQPSSPPPSQASAAYLPAGTILTVNTDPIDSREFLLQMGTNQAQVFQYFFDHYGVQDSANFWTTPHGGVTPLTMIKQLTMQQVVQLTVQLEMARARGMVGDITYGAILASMRQENQRRATAVAQHQPVYGLTSFTAPTYFSYVTTNLEVTLEQNLEQSMPPPATAVLEKLYEQLRSQDFACPSPSQGQPAIHQSSTIAQDCTSGTKYVPFAAVESQVLQDWKERQVGALIAANVRTARVQINHAVFDKVGVP